jgi:hypothetical protein
MIPRQHLPRLTFRQLEALAAVMTGLQALQQSIHRSKVTGMEAMVQLCSDLWDKCAEIGAPAQRAIANWDSSHPIVNPPPEEPDGTDGAV